jgi:hypothetical protein
VTIEKGEGSDESAQNATSSFVAVHYQTKNNSKAGSSSAYDSFTQRVDLRCSGKGSKDHSTLCHCGNIDFGVRNLEYKHSGYWNGEAWTTVTHPRAFPNSAVLRAVTPSSGGSAWSVGFEIEVSPSGSVTPERTLINKYTP